MSAVKVNAPIPHSGAVGYLLWLRRDLPRSYLQAVKTIPAIAAFEAGLKKANALGCCGLGDDSIDLSIDASSASAPDFSTTFDSPSGFSIDQGNSIVPQVTGSFTDASGSYSGSLNPAIPDVSIVSPQVPALPPIQSNSPGVQGWLSAAGSVASAVGSGIVQSLPAVANIVKAAAPVAVAAIQANAALKGAYPAQTGYFVNPATGQRYLSAISTPYGTSIAGNIPTWAIAAGLGGALLLLLR